MRIKTILVDDERKSLMILENKINRLCPEIEIINRTESPEKALVMIKELQPHLVFLDIAMPNMSGFDLLSKIDNPSFEIIFATAFDQYAINAIQYCAIGYLVKPIDNDDLLLGVKNAIKNIKEKTAFKKNKLLIENARVDNAFKKIAIPTGEGFEFIRIQEIIRCAGVTGYTKLFFKGRKSIVSSYSIGYFYKLLEHNNFCFCHKSHLVNLVHVERYLNEGIVQLIDNQIAPVSKSRKNDFLKRLKCIH